MSEVTAETVKPDLEARARRLGWKPQEEYKGRRDWVPAEQFIETAENELPVLRENLRKLDEKYVKDVNSLKGELGEIKQVLTDYREFASRGEQRAYERARKDLEDKRDTAVAHADTETFKQTQKELEELDKQAREVTKPKAEVEKPAVAVPDPAITSWIAENDWFSRDRELHAFAKSQDAYLIEAKPGLSVAERLEMVKERTKREFPDKFGNPRREQAAAVAEPGSQPSRKKGGKTYDDLPAEAKAACDKFVKSIPGFKKEDYVRDYDWSEA